MYLAFVSTVSSTMFVVFISRLVVLLPCLQNRIFLYKYKNVVLTNAVKMLSCSCRVLKSSDWIYGKRGETKNDSMANSQLHTSKVKQQTVITLYKIRRQLQQFSI